MPLKQLRLPGLLLAALLCAINFCFAQDYKKIERSIDSLAKKGLYKSALADVKKLDELAWKNKNAPEQVKSAMYSISLQQFLGGDATITTIDTLQRHVKKADFPVLPVLQSLLGQMYWNYYQRTRWQTGQRSRLEKPGNDFTKWDTQTIIDETSHLYQLSLADAKAEQQMDVGVLDGALAGDKRTRYLRPTLYDLLLQRALDFFLSDEPALTKPKLPFSINDERFFSDSRIFSQLNIKTTDTASTLYIGMRYLQQAELFHLQNNDSEALADLGLRRLSLLYTEASLPGKDSLYINALNKVAADFSSKPISAYAFAMLGHYYQGKDSLNKAVDYYKKAVDLFPNSVGGQNSASYIHQIEETQLSAVVEDINIPHKPLLALLNYRNLKTAQLFIYKVSATQYGRFSETINNFSFNTDSARVKAYNTAFSNLKKQRPVQQELVQLPAAQDYKPHRAEFKINALDNGFYVMAVIDTSEKYYFKQLATFKVNDLAYVTRVRPDEKTDIRVMSRETGLPLQGVNVTVDETRHYVTDANGACIVDNNEDLFSIKFTTPVDTLYIRTHYDRVYRVRNQNQEEEPDTSTVIFTDRSLYRPGQTVYFKGFQTQHYRDKDTILIHSRVTVEVKDNSQKPIISIPVVTNDFGTFSGSFIIPQNILNGQVLISTGYGNKYIRVEEYKRPTFQAEFLPVEAAYKPNDSVTVKGTVMAYSGYGLSQARVAWHVTRTALPKDYRYYNQYGFRLSQNTEIAADTIKTDSKGLFEIKFKAVPDAGVDLKDVNYSYAISADVTDGNGETRPVHTSLIIGSNNCLVVAEVPEKALSRDSIKIAAKITNLDNRVQNGSLHVMVYSLNEPEGIFKARLWTKPDQYLLSYEQFKKDFPDYVYKNEDEPGNWAVKDKVFDVNRNTETKAGEIFNLDVLRKQPAGTYKVIIEAKNDSGDTASIVKYLYLINEPSKPQNAADWVIPITTTVNPGTPAEFLVGNGGENHILMEKYDGSQLLSSQWLTISGNQQVIKVPVLKGEKGFSVQFSMAYQNRMYTYSRQIIVRKPDDNLGIKFLTFRDRLQPGEKEQWKLQVTGKNNEKLAAEMVASLYDASLDDIARPASWETILNRRYFREQTYDFNWVYDNFIGSASTTGLSYRSRYNYRFTQYNYEHLVEFDFEVTYKTDTLEYKSAAYKSSADASAGIMQELSIADPGQKNLKGDRNAITTVRINGKDFIGGDIDAATRNLPADILKNIQMIDDYGNQANLTGVPAIRKNFNETAFFYPELYTNEKGEILIDFTMPESLTKWRFKAFAHTKDLKTGYVESEVVTQKKLSISANMPRFFREGDTITVSARLANLTKDALKGKVQMLLFNGLNMQPVSLLADAKEANQNFDIDGTSTKTVSFKLIIPAGLDAITYRLTAAAGNYSDGEENTFPVLPNRMLVTESMPMMVRGGQTRAFTFNKLVNQSSTTLKNKTLTLEYTQNPAWYAVQALPYMMEFPYECSEQTFSRYYANSMGTNLVNHLPVIKQVFGRWKAANSTELLSNLEKNQELKSTLIEETPWLRDAQSEPEQEKRIAMLFDLNRMSYELQTNLDKLKQKQLPDGGFPWFEGDLSDHYITQYILCGIGQLYHLHIADTQNLELKAIADRAMVYLDKTLIDAENQAKNATKNYKARALTPEEIHAYYTQSYFVSRTMNATAKALLANYLTRAESQWLRRSIYEQGMIALTMMRDKKPEVAKTIIRSLLETAQQSDDLGMYWAKNTLGYYWYQSPVETQCLLIELFTEAGNNDKAVEEMKIWLLRNKQANDWKTTKATAQACYALLMKGDNWLAADAGLPNIKLNGKDLSDLKPGVKTDAGTGYIKTNWIGEQVQPALGKVVITNTNKTVNWGALHWQYLENLDKITPSQTGVQLERKYFIRKQTDAGQVLTAVDATHQPKIGDLLKVVVYLKADRDFEYIQLKDMRPAGTEPVDALSGYKYQDGLSYYQVTKDVATNFFISNLNKGNYVFEYSLRVAQAGNFSTGITTMQSMYAPEFNTHSEGRRLIVKP